MYSTFSRVLSCTLCFVLAFTLTGCGGSANDAAANSEQKPVPLPQVTVGGETVTFTKMRVEWNQESKTLGISFYTDEPQPEFKEGEVPKEPPMMGLSLVISDPAGELVKDNVEEARLVISGVPEWDSIHFIRHVESAIVSLSGKIGKGKPVKVEFDWQEGNKSAKAIVDGTAAN